MIARTRAKSHGDDVLDRDREDGDIGADGTDDGVMEGGVGRADGDEGDCVGLASFGFGDELVGSLKREADVEVAESGEGDGMPEDRETRVGNFEMGDNEAKPVD